MTNENYISCKICRAVFDQPPNSKNDKKLFDCNICGQYEITNATLEKFRKCTSELNNIQRSAISYIIKQNCLNDSIVSFSIENICSIFAKAKLPSPAIQINNIIEYTGDYYIKYGEYLPELPIDFHSITGFPDRRTAFDLLEELVSKELLKCKEGSLNRIFRDVEDLRLTVDGWKMHDLIKHGIITSHYGFIAMKFNCPILDSIVKKPHKTSNQSRVRL